MTRRADQIGFSQRVRLEWLEQTANLILAGNGKAAVNDALQELLKDKVSVGGQAERGNREKIITILLKTWLTVPSELKSLRAEGLELLKRVPRCDHLAIHWGMVTAVYPFWSGVATQTGRLLRLQGSAAAAHVQRRVREQYGERETVSRAARRVLRSYLDWGVLQETGAKGIYSAGATLAVDDSRLIAWLVEASLLARANSTAPLKDLIDSPSLFPFRIKAIQAESLRAASPRLDILRHGLDDDLVMLGKQTTKGGTMTMFQRTSQAMHPIEGLERPVSFTSFPEHTLLESGKLPIAEIAEGRPVHQFDLRHPYAGSRASLVFNFAQF